MLDGTSAVSPQETGMDKMDKLEQVKRCQISELPYLESSIDDEERMQRGETNNFCFVCERHKWQHRLCSISEIDPGHDQYMNRLYSAEKVHEIKVWPEYFDVIETGRKNFEVRKNDRDYKEGHVVLLHEYDNKKGEYSGKILAFEIGYVLQGGQFGIPDNYCVFSLVEL